MMFHFIGTIYMKCQILFSGENKKYISKCPMLIFVASMLSIKRCYQIGLLSWKCILSPYGLKLQVILVYENIIKKKLNRIMVTQPLT